MSGVLPDIANTLAPFCNWRNIMHAQSCSVRCFDSFLGPLASITANHCVNYSWLWQHSPRLFWLNKYRCARRSNQLIAIPTDTCQLCSYAILVELRVGNDVELMGLFDGLRPNAFDVGTPDAVVVGLNGAFSALDLAGKVISSIIQGVVPGEDGRFRWGIVPDWETKADTISLSLAIVRLQDGSFTRLCGDERGWDIPDPNTGNLAFFPQEPPDTVLEDDPPFQAVRLDFTFALTSDLHLEFGVHGDSFENILFHGTEAFTAECEHLIVRDWSHCEWI